MKSLIMTAQDAREFEKLGSLIISKPIKPTPAAYVEGAEMKEAAPGVWNLIQEGVVYAHDNGAAFTPPAQVGDAVLIREPWYRLKNSDGEPSERVILAADSTVSEGQTAYKWASPVSMPESAARRFAQVEKVEPEYNENVAVWYITLKKLTAAEAAKLEGPPPISSATDPEEGSDRFTYAGDMSPEDHERMVKAIDADRARLDEVQDRIIWIAARRIAISGGATQGERMEDGLLEEEQAALQNEERELRAALEDAGVRTRTVEARARERLAQIEALEVDTIKTAAADKHKNVDKTLEIIKEERETLASYIASAPARAAEESNATESHGDPPTVDGEPPAEEPAARDGEGGGPTAEEDEEVGSFTLGKCKYCGQLQEVGPHPSQAAADETASEVCNCTKARIERRVHEQIEDACERVQRLFGEGAEDLGFKPIHDEAVSLLERVVELIARGPISSASINIRGQGKAKFSITSKGKIKVSRSETRSCDLESGE